MFWLYFLGAVNKASGEVADCTQLDTPCLTPALPTI